MADTEQSVPVE